MPIVLEALVDPRSARRRYPWSVLAYYIVLCWWHSQCEHPATSEKGHLGVHWEWLYSGILHNLDASRSNGLGTRTRCYGSRQKRNILEANGVLLSYCIPSVLSTPSDPWRERGGGEGNTSPY